MTQDGLTQIIHEPSPLIDCSFSFTDLVFTSQDSVVTKSGIHFSLQIK